ncbi:NAD(P)-binding domain-containing protein [Oxalobacteraceae bacterium]|nr:NAD(P)-binding domain-containing protein [Oxalobacteraceae bacterium]
MRATTSSLPVAVLGAGPIGLAAAAHLIERGLTPLIFEAAGSIAANLQSYRHVRLFSPWRYNIDQAARRLLEGAGWQAPAADGMPGAGELIAQYLAPLAALPQLAQGLKLGHRVIAVSRQGFDKVTTAGRDKAAFVIRVATAEGEREFLASAVLDASGTWSQANPLGANGLPALGEAELSGRIAYGMPDVLGTERERYAGRRVLVVGAGHSATGTLLALAELARQTPGTQLVWALRGRQLTKLFGGGAADGLPARGELGARLKALEQAGKLELHMGCRIAALREHGGKMQVVDESGMAVIDDIDEIVAATGARPDLGLSRELRVRNDPWLESTDALAPLIDPNAHSCGTVRPHGHRELAHPEPDYYVVGAKSYGRAPNFLMVTGYEQVRSVVAALAGDLVAADALQLELPETGVCHTGFSPADSGANACCGGPAPVGSGSCCALDRTEKAKGAAGCATSTSCRPAAAAASGCCP